MRLSLYILTTHCSSFLSGFLPVGHLKSKVVELIPIRNLFQCFIDLNALTKPDFSIRRISHHSHCFHFKQGLEEPHTFFKMRCVDCNML